MTIHRCNRFIFRDYLPYPDPMTTISIENAQENKENSASEIQPQIVRRNKRLSRNPSNNMESRKRESFARNLFQSTKKLREELGVSFLFSSTFLSCSY